MNEMKRTEIIHWDRATAVAKRFALPGPQLSPEEIHTVVQHLRKSAERSVDYVHEITGLSKGSEDPQVLVVTREGWVKANTQSFAATLSSPLAQLEARLEEKWGRKCTSTNKSVGGALAGIQVGAVLTLLASRILGQYDPFSPEGSKAQEGAGGRLLLVAPNIVAAERELGVEEKDFRLWVCLHEQTHRFQFAAAPWMRGYILRLVDELGHLLLGQMEDLGGRFVELLRPNAQSKEFSQRFGKISFEREREIFSKLTATMSLLEGYANVVMDAVSTQILPTVNTIRERFTARISKRSVLERRLRRFLALDAKMLQYSDGAKFVRAVIGLVGMDGMNTIWNSQEFLPSEDELHNPKHWVERIHR